MDEIIRTLRAIETGEIACLEELHGARPDGHISPIGVASRRLEECRALLERLANDEPAPEGHTFQSWARELLA